MKSSLSDAGVLFEILSSSSLASLKIEARLHLSAQIWAPYRATGLTSASNRVVAPFTINHAVQCDLKLKVDYISPLSVI